MAADTLDFPFSTTAGGAATKTFRLPLFKIDATAAPGAGNDDSQGYAKGSLWVDTTNKHCYQCADNSTGAAVWKQLDNTGGSAFSQSTASQGAGFASDTYVTGSGVAVPAGGLQAGTRYRCVFNVTKTAAGVAVTSFNIRFGVNGTTADTLVGTLTFSAQTAVADEGVFEVWITFRTVGSGTSAVLGIAVKLSHRLATTGLTSAGAVEVKAGASGGFNSTTAGAILGISVNAGASAAWTVDVVQAALENLP